MSKEQTYWCVYTRYGEAIPQSTRHRKKDAIDYMVFPGETWTQLKKRSGYTVQKVTINIVTK